MARYTVVLKHSDEGFSVWCPSLPGCCSQGETEEEALENIRVAISEYMEVRKELFPHEETREVEVSA